MALVKINKEDVKKIIGERSDEKIDEVLSMFGAGVEAITEDQIEVEIAPNRPDFLSQQGLLRGLKSYFGKIKGIKQYNLNKPEKNYNVKIDSSVKEVRPYTSCAIIKSLSLNDQKIKEIIELQEKLHSTLGRNRKKVAIGIYPLEKISLPITYKAEKPEKIKFIPLDSDREMNAKEILKKHPAGVAYSNLLSKAEVYPIFVDAKSKILSLPPIINSEETGRVTESTKEVFVECSGFNFEAINKALNIIITALADMGGEVYQMNLSYSNQTIKTPDLTPEKIKVSPENVNKLLGLNLKDKDIEKLLSLMGLEYVNESAIVPAWRTDILHEVDIIEDIAIAYGYEKFIPQLPKISTIGEESEKSRFYSKTASLIAGLEITEISTYFLIKQKEAEISKIEKKLEAENSKTEYKFLRPNLLIPALRIFSENKNNEYPQKIFEIGTVFSIDKEEKTETGILETENLIIAVSPGNFTEIKKILNYLSENLGFSYTLKEKNKIELIDGRTASILINGHEVGYFGEVHPESLNDWGIKMPISVLEVSLEDIFNQIKNNE